MTELKLIYLLGDPVAHSLSPDFQNAGLQALRLPWKYIPEQVSTGNLAALLNGLGQPGIAGANITIPHKIAALPLLDTLNEEAKMIGAINTVVARDGKLTGYNTDIKGFLRALRDRRPEGLAGRGVLLVGSGGAARAAAAGIVREELSDHIYLLSRTREKSVQLIDIINRCREEENRLEVTLLEDFSDIGPGIRESVGLIINATPAGMNREKQAVPFPSLAGFSPQTLLFDFVYSHTPTWLQRQAAQAGLDVEDGLNTLLYQGMKSFSLWTGFAPPEQIMREALQKALNKRKGRET